MKKSPGRRQFLRTLSGTAFALAAFHTAKPAAAAVSVDVSATGKCATCAYWGGERRVDPGRGVVEAGDKGYCNNPQSPAYQKQTRPTQGAPVWEKWPALK